MKLDTMHLLDLEDTVSRLMALLKYSPLCCAKIEGYEDRGVDFKIWLPRVHDPLLIRNDSDGKETKWQERKRLPKNQKLKD